MKAKHSFIHHSPHSTHSLIPGSFYSILLPCPLKTSAFELPFQQFSRAVVFLRFHQLSFSAGFLPICKSYGCRPQLVALVVDVSPGGHPRLFISLPSASSLARVFWVLEFCNFHPSMKENMVAPCSPRGRARHLSPQRYPQSCLPPKGGLTWSEVSWGSLSSHFGAGVSDPLFQLRFPFFFPPLPQTLRHKLQKTKEQAWHQEQLLKEQERELKALQEQLSR